MPKSPLQSQTMSANISFQPSAIVPALYYSKWMFILATAVRWIANIWLSIVMSLGKCNCIRGISPKSKPKFTRNEMKEIDLNKERAVLWGSAVVDLLTLNPSTWILTSKSKHLYLDQGTFQLCFSDRGMGITQKLQGDVQTQLTNHQLSFSFPQGKHSKCSSSP